MECSAIKNNKNIFFKKGQAILLRKWDHWSFNTSIVQ